MGTAGYRAPGADRFLTTIEGKSRTHCRLPNCYKYLAIAHLTGTSAFSVNPKEESCRYEFGKKYGRG